MRCGSMVDTTQCCLKATQKKQAPICITQSKYLVSPAERGLKSPLRECLPLEGDIYLLLFLFDPLMLTFNIFRYRYGHTGVYDRETDTTIIFGGRVELVRNHGDMWVHPNGGDATKELWAFNMAALTWTLLRPKGYDVIETFGHQAVLVKNEMFVLGGMTKNNELAWQFAKYNIAKNAWTSESTQGAFPGGIHGHSAVYYEKGNAILVFGGQGRVRMKDGLVTRTRNLFTYHRYSSLNSLWIYSLDRKVWTLGPDAGLSSGRFMHSSWIMSNYLFVHGGSPFSHNSEKVCVGGGLLVFDLNCGNWLNKSYPVFQVYFIT